ncbi:hypothetical protein ABZP36_004788 [Zizania latifolia]
MSRPHRGDGDDDEKETRGDVTGVVPSMMICGLPSVDEEFLQFEDKAMQCGNLSSTLQKLYMWEKKLLEEIKVLTVLYSFIF